MATGKIKMPTEIQEYVISGTTDSNGNIYDHTLSTVDHIVLAAYASSDHSCSFMLDGTGTYWNYHISDYNNWNVGSGVSVYIFVKYMYKR